jgi:tryptophan synthase alpha chain
LTQYNKGRLKDLFSKLKLENRGGLGIFITASDPNLKTSLDILKGLPQAGADMIELGIPFSDPMADGPTIQASSLRALKSGGSLTRTLEMVAEFRKTDNTTPLVLMGYYNPIYSYGVKHFLIKAIADGVDGLIIVDLPPEEDDELCIPATKYGLPFIRLATPTSNDDRLPTILKNASGFIYYVSIMGITGTQSITINSVKNAVSKLRSQSKLPIVVGFGIKTQQHVAEVTQIADAAIVGSAVVNVIEESLDSDGNGVPKTTENALALVRNLALGLRGNVKNG